MTDQANMTEALTKREQEVAEAYATGQSYKEIARDLGLSPTTVRSHLRTVYSKLGVTSKIELAQFLSDASVPEANRDTTGLVADLALELDEAVRRERGLAQILQIISKQDDKLEPVIDAVLDHALEICEAEFGVLFEFQGEMQARELQSRNVAPAFEAWMREQGVFRVDPNTAIGRMATTKQTVNISDVRGEDVYQNGSPLRIATADLGKARSFAAIPMMSGGQLIGAFTVYRTRVHPFNDRSLELAQVFADQAVIAIENVRQIHELQARLERAAATREILDVISQSRDDEAPVFEAIVSNVGKLCDGANVALHLAHSERTYATYAAGWGDPTKNFEPGVSKWPLEDPLPLTDAIRDAKVINIADTAEDDPYAGRHPDRAMFLERDSIRSQLVVPLLSAGQGVGCFEIYRREAKPFTEDEIALVEGFAAQAVIAIENVRQFQELQARLESAQSNREILELIRTSRNDEQPVFDAIAWNAADLCKAQFCMLWRYDGTDIHHCASSGFTREFMDEYLADYPMPPNPAGIVYQVIQSKHTVQLPNAQAEPYSDAAVARQHGYDYMLALPVETDGKMWGILVLGWPEGLTPGDDKVELLETFAAQAVIAIENVRQFRELQTRLEREAATREILQVISQSRDDEQPVFDVILRQAATLCRSPQAGLIMLNEAQTHAKFIAGWGPPTKHFEVGATEWSIDDPIAVTTSIRETRVVNIHNLLTDALTKDAHPSRLEIIEKEGIRSVLAVPLISGGKAIGCVDVYRLEVDPFTDDEVALIQSFAAQAVIAIENVQQFKALEKLNAKLGDQVEEQVGEIERMGKLKRFLPAAVADTVISSGSEAMLKSHRALLGVLFCDIRGFTAFCESAEPEETIEILQNYHEEMGKLINAHGAGVDHRMGDGIMVLFNDPLPCDDPSGDAVRLAIAMRARMAELCKQWKRLGHRLGFGVGVSLGYATVGMVGFEGRFDYTASGTAVNLAARLCDVAEDGEILLSPRAGVAVEDSFHVESRGEINFKGIREPVEVFKLAGHAQA